MQYQTMCLRGAAVASLMVFVASAGAVDLERGRLLYENHCTVCHQSTVHIRTNRKAHSLPDVAKQVHRWSEELKLGWSAEERDDVLRYLDREFYHFSRPVSAD